jgi:hypothetical protein
MQPLEIHEIMVTEEECHRATERDGLNVICPMLPELQSGPISQPVLTGKYSSANAALDRAGLREWLAPFLDGKSEAGVFA